MKFLRNEANPIITKDTGTFDSSDIANPDVFYDTPNSRWVMNYSAYGTIVGDASPKWRMCLAYSTNLLVWNKEAANPVFGPISGEGYIACNGSIVLKSGVYYHFYLTGNSNDTASTKIRLATSTDLINWTRKNGGNPIIVGTAGTFDSLAVYDPCVRLMDDGVTFEMTYAASDGANNSIGKATSTDGTTWIKQGKILSLQGWFNSSSFAEPAHVRIDNALYLCWDAAISAGVRSLAMGLTFNTGKDWQFLGVVLKGSGSGWDSLQVFDGYILFHNNKIYLFYAGGTVASGTQGMNSQIGVAVSDYVKQTI